jgi:hypothetical protein
MDLKGLRRGILLGAAIVTLCAVGGARAQESLDRGKSATQLFASDCSACHKSPQALAKAGGLFGLDSFLRTHYTASRESATTGASIQAERQRRWNRSAWRQEKAGCEAGRSQGRKQVFGIEAARGQAL